MAKSFQFDLVSPERQLLSESVTAVNVPGSEGYFTVMAGHAPMMTTLKPGVISATLESGTEKRIYVRGGFADVNESGFTLLAERATPVEEMNAAELDRQIKDAEEDVADASTPEAKSRAAHALAQLKDSRAALGL
ncbi:F0F1 ATP synthase subunit epsilon [Aurantimonas sp. Leaf443]|uniref:F0F1 ATP synthase subunit epsilon n=1 Tax=Aurantimonas sp. Leaf443 TaxID=1736378 RepID=UPI0006F9B5A3|nr:F0F1 ATP synthase subunit epsilon [Aurantimonas sp. Leaf443]KQT87511.1 ATP synthase F1 subunit epsilon [Aurantimonas sp. Leaf443]